MAGKTASLELPLNLPNLPPDWSYRPLGALVAGRGISYGIVQPGKHKPDGIPIIRVNNIKNGRISGDDVLRVSADIEASYERTRLRGGEVLLTLVGSLGETGIVPPQFVGWNVARAVGVIPVEADIGNRWVALCLRSQFAQRYIQMWATTTVQATFNLRDVARLPIPIPPKREREAITHILGTLDDKIELNRRMNETLEAMARALFKSWFVDFDPVRAKADGRPTGLPKPIADLFPNSFQDSELGKVPKGWRIGPLPEIVEVNPPRTLSKGSIAPYLDMKNMPTRGHCPDEIINRAFSSGTKFSKGDTLLARITPCLENGKTAFVDFLDDGEVGWGSTEFIVLHPKPPLPPEFGYYLARSDDLRSFAIQNMTGTSGRQRVPPDCFNQYLLVLPPEPIARRFGDLVRPIVRQISANSRQSKMLARTRDTLLPRLLSANIGIYSVHPIP